MLPPDATLAQKYAFVTFGETKTNKGNLADKRTVFIFFGPLWRLTHQTLMPKSNGPRATKSLGMRVRNPRAHWAPGPMIRSLALADAGPHRELAHLRAPTRRRRQSLSSLWVRQEGLPSTHASFVDWQVPSAPAPPGDR